MTSSVRIGLAATVIVLTFGGAALAQGVSVDTRTRGSGAVGLGPGGVGSTLSGSNRIDGNVAAPGVGADVRGRTTGQGSIGVGRGGIDSGIGTRGRANTGIRVER